METIVDDEDKCKKRMQSNTNSCFWIIITLLTLSCLLVGNYIVRSRRIKPIFHEIKNDNQKSNINEKEIPLKDNSDLANYLNNLFDVQNKIKEKQQDIWNTWNVSHFPLFLASMDIPELTWNIQKHKFILKLLQTNSDYIVGFSGSSITAGHDSFFNESFPIVFYDDLYHIMKQLNISFEVRNHALGNNPCYPYDACIPTHIGDDLDMITWEQSMNCGHDPKPLESFTRHAVRAIKKPIILYMQSGTPYWKPEDCNGQIYERDQFTNNELFHLNRSVKSIATESLIIEEMEFLQPARRKDRAQLHKHINVAYKSAPIMGQNSLSVEPYKCLGPYGIDFGLKTGGGGSSWHPGKKGHQIRGNMMSFFILEILYEAIEELTKGLNKYSVKLMKSLSSKYLFENQMQNPPIKPIACDPKICNSDPVCFTEFEPRVSHSLRDIVVGAQSTEWTLDLSFFDAKAVLKAQLKQRGYLDKKFIYMSHSVINPLSIVVKPTKTSSIWLCELQKGFLQYPSWLGDLDSYANVYVDLSIPFIDDTHALMSYKPNKDHLIMLNLTVVEDFCYQTTPLPPGAHVLSIYQKNASVQINLAYVLYW